VTLKDLIYLRTTLAARGRLSEDWVSWCADGVQAEFGWSMRQKQPELADAQASGLARLCGMGEKPLGSGSLGSIKQVG
jgi:hypothetical protein